MDSIWFAIMRIIICLPLVLGLAFVIVKYGISRSMLQPQTSNMTVLERIALMPKSGLFIVKVEDRYLLIGATENNIVLLKELNEYIGAERQDRLNFLETMKKVARRQSIND